MRKLESAFCCYSCWQFGIGAVAQYNDQTLMSKRVIRLYFW